MSSSAFDPLAEVLATAARGWPVFPLHSVGTDGRCSCGSHPCGPDNRNAGKHPRISGWQTSATKDPEQIAAWAASFGVCNWAMPTGPASGVDVLDVDPRNGGQDSLDGVEDTDGKLPETPIDLTGGGGLHVLFAHPAGHYVTSRSNALGPGLDVKGDGGYIVIPPSVHASGRPYAWNLSAHPDELTLAPWPETLLRRVNGTPTKPESPATITSSSPMLSRPKDAARNDTLWNYAVRWACLGLGESEVRTFLYKLADDWELLAENRGGEVENIIRGAMLKAKREAPDTEPELGPALDLYDPSVVPVKPEFAVANLIRRAGLHLIWAEPSAGKTWTLLRWAHEMMLPPEVQRAKLTEHPELWINRRWARVLWIATEEDAETLRYKADYIRRGLDVDGLDGTILYRFAADTRRRLTLDDLPELIEQDGPLDAIVLDSLTGLRPKTVNGERVRWDVDNDAANELCIRLRGLACKHALALALVHHTGRDTSRGYRGPTDWWASADVMLGLVPDAGRTKVMLEKNRDGKRLAPFFVTPSWEGDRYTLDYGGAAVSAKLTKTAEAVLAFFRGSLQATQAQVVAAGVGARGTVRDAIAALVVAGQIADTGNRVNQSPIYRFVGGEGGGQVAGAVDDE